VARARSLGEELASEIDRLLQSGCDFGEPSACTMIGRRVMHADPERAKRLMIKGCAASIGSDVECESWR
jgi:hypothetical protein